MSYTHRRLHSLHAQDLIKLSDNLDSLSVSEHPWFKNILNNTLETAQERNERDDYYKKKNNQINYKLQHVYNDYVSKMYNKLEKRSQSSKKGSFLHMELLNPVKNQSYKSQTKLVIVLIK